MEQYQIVEEVVRAMEIVEGVLNLKGYQKKQETLKLMSIKLGSQYEKYITVISCVIDLICDLTKNSKKVKVNDLKRIRCLPWC